MPRRTSPTYNAVVLLSGGLDSALNLALACRHRGATLALTFDYGQRAARAEGRAARKLCSFYGVDRRVVKLPWFRDLLPDKLARPGAPLPSRPSDVEAVWVPNRNGVFVAVGAAVAEAFGASVVVAGFNAEEAAQFPDNSAAFVRASSRALRYSTAGRVKLASYTASLDKAAIVRKAVRLGVPLKYVYPCYGEGPRPCGRCSSCRRTVAALETAGYPDLRAEIFGGARRVG
jgi:7-cyano-7-deazaguanine synthase